MSLRAARSGWPSWARRSTWRSPASQGLIDRAEARALVARVRDDSDRRTCRVALTGSGAELVVRFRDDVSRELNALAADLPESTRDELTAAIWEIISSQDVSAIFGVRESADCRVCIGSKIGGRSPNSDLGLTVTTAGELLQKLLEDCNLEPKSMQSASSYAYGDALSPR